MTMTVYAQVDPAARFPVGEASGLNAGQPEETLRLHAAARRGHHADAAFLIAAGADLNAQDAGGETALHLALRLGDAAMTSLLLLSGADAAMETPEGVAPRTLARLSGGGLLLRLLDEALMQQTISSVYGLKAA